MTERELVRHVLAHHQQKAWRELARRYRLHLALDFKRKNGHGYGFETRCIGLDPELDAVEVWWRMECWAANNTRDRVNSAIERFRKQRTA